MLKNMYMHYQTQLEAGALEDGMGGHWLELFLVGSTLGAQSGKDANLSVFNGGMTSLAGTVIFTAYLLWLASNNARRAKATQESTISAADYAVAVSGLSSLPPEAVRSEEDVADFFATEVVRSWDRRRQRSRRKLSLTSPRLTEASHSLGSAAAERVHSLVRASPRGRTT